MPISVATITAPADLIVQFLYQIKLVYFCSFFAYDGLRHGITLTHFGMRKGLIARLYGIFYLIWVIIFLIQIPGIAKSILETDPATLLAALSFAIPDPPLGFIIIGLSLFLFLSVEGLIRFTRKSKWNKSSTRDRIRRIRAGRPFLYWMCAFPLTIGLQALIGLPYWMYVGIMGFFIYFAPFASPQKIKKLFTVTEVDNSSRPKSGSVWANLPGNQD